MSTETVSPDRIRAAFDDRELVCRSEVSVTRFLADKLPKPLLLEGPPGVGKTEIGKLWSSVRDLRLVWLREARA